MRTKSKLIVITMLLVFVVLLVFSYERNGKSAADTSDVQSNEAAQHGSEPVIGVSEGHGLKRSDAMSKEELQGIEAPMQAVASTAENFGGDGVRSYRFAEITRLVDLVCSEAGGKRFPYDSRQSQSQTLLMLSIATVLDEMGRGEVATGPYVIPPKGSTDRVFSVNGRIYRFSDYEFPEFDDFVELITNPETGDFYELVPPSSELPAMEGALVQSICGRAQEALAIHDSYRSEEN